MKYSSTLKPSLKLDLMGKSIILPDGFVIRPRIPPSVYLGHITFARGGHHVNAAQWIQGFLCGLSNFIGGLHPYPDYFIVSFIFRDETILVLTFDENRLFFGSSISFGLDLGTSISLMAIVVPDFCGKFESHFFDSIHYFCHVFITQNFGANRLRFLDGRFIKYGIAETDSLGKRH